MAHAKKKKNALFLGMGDYTDGISTSERQVIGNGALHDTTTNTLELVYKQIVKKLGAELGFMKGRLIGLLGGNHFVQFRDGSNSDNQLCDMLGAKFLGVCSFIRLTIDFEGRHAATAIDIFAHHGKGGGSTPGSTFNTIEKMLAGADADLYLMGHDHRKGCIPSTPRLRVSHGSGSLKIRSREPWLGRTGSFLKAYEDNAVSYNVDAGRAPCALGHIEFEITPMRHRKDGDDHVYFKIRGTS